MNSVSYLRGTERVLTLTIPTTSKAGDLLYMLEGNPLSAPRARAVASQFDSWSSPLELEVETTGNAFSKNFILIRHLPNGDPARIPPSGQSLLNIAEAYDRKDESVKLQLDSNAKAVCRAPWNLSYNPRKPIQDTDPSERNLGVFIIVSNGSPGTESVDITIRFRYDFRFYGPIYSPLVVDASQQLQNTTTSVSSPFTGATVQGPGTAVFTGNVIRFTEAGSYMVAVLATITDGSISTTTTGTVFKSLFNTNSAKYTSVNLTLVAQANATVTLTITGTLSKIELYIATFNANPPTVLNSTLPNRILAPAVNTPSTLESIANFATQLNTIQGTIAALESLVGKARRPRNGDGAGPPHSEPPDPNRIG